MYRVNKSLFIWALLPLLLILMVGIRILTILNGTPANTEISIAISGFVIVVVGVLIVSRQPANTIGWLLVISSGCMYLAEFSYQWARYSLITNPGALPFGLVVGWFSLWLWTPVIFCLFILLPLLFPTGRPLSPGWRKVALLGWFEFILTIFMFGLRPGPMEGLEPIPNPLGLNLPISFFDTLDLISTVSLLVLVGLAFFSFVIRYRVSLGEARLQMKWFLFAFALLFATAARGILSEYLGLFPALPEAVDNALFSFNIALIVIAIGIAILKYRLYEIDVIIRKTLVYGSLTFSLAMVYFGSIALMQSIIRPFGMRDSPFGVILSTLVIAALFSPLRRRIQIEMDRRFYRSKYNAEKILSNFSAGLRDQVDLEQTTAQLVRTIQETMMPTHMSVWIKPPSGSSTYSKDETTPPSPPG